MKGRNSKMEKKWRERGIC